MKTPRVLYHLARADLLERARRPSFLLALGVTLYLGYAVTSGQIVLHLGDYRGLYNSAWVGFLAATVSTMFASLAGFYVVKNTLERDRQTGVGQIIAATPVSTFNYLLGKMLSNLAILAAIGAVVALFAVALQFIAGEDMHLDLWQILSPFLLLYLPAMTLVAAVAVLFEAVPLLHGGIGNALYFFLWMLSLAEAALHPHVLKDWLGVLHIDDIVRAADRAGAFTAGGGISIEIINIPLAKTFPWEGLSWTLEGVLSRLYWIGVALALILLATALFNRFDPARGFFRQYGLLVRRLSTLSWPRRRRPRVAPPPQIDVKVEEPAQRRGRLTALRRRPVVPRFGRMLLAELRLMLSGQPWWWYIVAAVLIAASMGIASEVADPVLGALAWLWPLLIWSAMGARETRHRTAEFVLSVAHPLRQLPATWLAGVLVALLTGSGAAARLILARSWPTLGAWAVGALFVPALALALGVWSGSSRLFEAVYVVLWYAGPISHVSALDFMGAWMDSASRGVPWYYLGATAALLTIAFLGRRRQLQVY